MMSRDLINGVQISNDVTVSENCVLVNDTDPIFNKGVECYTG